MPSNLMPFGEWRPDVADYEGQHSKFIQNVVPQGDGYGPVASFLANSATLPGACRGLFFAYKNDGTVAIFAATATNLYLFNATNSTWTNVSLSGGPYTSVPATDNWTFAQFNNFVFAVTSSNAPQVIDLTNITNGFAALGGSPPSAKYVSVVNQFVVLSGIASPNVYRVQWSGLDATTTWTAGVSQSDFQDLADGGIVRGVVGGEFGFIFQDQAIRQLTYSPGSPYVFEIDKISSNDGLLAPYAAVQVGGVAYYISPSGFKKLIPGLLPQPIGKERIDRYFFANADLTNNPQLCIATVDPRATRIYWAYKSINGTAGQFDTILVYDYALDRWSQWSVSGQYLTTLSQPGLTLEAVDAAYGDNTVYATVSATSVTKSTGAGDTWNVPNTLKAGQGVNFQTSGTLPSAYVVGTPYYVITTGLTTSSFKLSTGGGVGQLQGSASTSTSSGSGSFSMYVPSIETLTIGSLDDIPVNAEPQLGGIGPTNAMGFFNGPNLQAILESAEHGDGYKRIYVNGFRPITDAAGCYGTIIYRETEQSSPTTGTEQQVNAIGSVPQRKSVRYARAKLRIPAATSWSFASGVEPDVKDEGLR